MTDMLLACCFSLNADTFLWLLSSTAQSFAEIVGTPFYMAPEVLERCYGPAADIWSAGVVIYLMIAGCLPFNGNTDRQIIKAVMDSEPDFSSDVWQHTSQLAVDFLQQMLAKDPSKRASISQLLSHPWMAGRGVSSSSTGSSRADAPAAAVAAGSRRSSGRHSDSSSSSSNESSSSSSRPVACPGSCTPAGSSSQQQRGGSSGCPAGVPVAAAGDVYSSSSSSDSTGSQQLRAGMATAAAADAPGTPHLQLAAVATRVRVGVW